MATKSRTVTYERGESFEVCDECDQELPGWWFTLWTRRRWARLQFFGGHADLCSPECLVAYVKRRWGSPGSREEGA